MTPFINSRCPVLPSVQPLLAISHTRAHRLECGSAYFHACLELAQSLWQSGKPAQALLQLDKSFMANHSTPDWVPKASYLGILFIIQHAPQDQFIGNPVRHFQHLASRMNQNQPNPELRTLRAWACLHLTEKYCPSPEFARDSTQLQRENISIPSLQEVTRNLIQLGHPREAEFLTRCHSMNSLH